MEMAQEAYELMKVGAIKGLSIGFNPTVKEYDDNKKVRYIKEVDLWEISLVTFPANTRAKVTVVKAIEEANNVRDMENALREAGLSNSISKYIAKLCKPSLREAETVESDSGLLSILDSLRKTNTDFEENRNINNILQSLKRVNY